MRREGRAGGGGEKGARERQALTHRCVQAVQTRGGQARAPCDMGAVLRGLAEAGLKPTAVDGLRLDVARWQSWPWDVVWEV